MPETTTQEPNLRAAFKRRIVSLIERPAVEKKQTKPANMIGLAYAGFLIAFGFLDLITAITIGMITNPLYGILTFLAGFIPMVVDEVLFVRPYASKYQKWIAAAGVGLGILSTLAIGILAGAVNAMSYFEMFALSNVQAGLEIAMLASLVILVGLHGGLFLAYVQVDEAIHRAQKRQQQLAYHEEQREKIGDAKAIVKDVQEIEKEINEIESQGDLDALNAALTSIGGRAVDPNTPAGTLTDEGFQYHAELPTAGHPFRPSGEIQP